MNSENEINQSILFGTIHQKCFKQFTIDILLSISIKRVQKVNEREISFIDIYNEKEKKE